MTLSISPFQKTGKELISVCANNLLNSIPPLWCWKKDGNASKIPKRLSSRLVGLFSIRL